MPTNLNKLAATGSTKLVKNCQTVIDIDATGKINQFYTWLARKMALSVNAGPDTLIKILQLGKYQSAWEFSATEADAMKHFGSRSGHRKIFDETFEHGKRFKYLAVNAGNMGLPAWGKFAVILKMDYFEDDKLAFLACNSLRKTGKNQFYFFLDEKTVNLTLLEAKSCSLPVLEAFVTVHRNDILITGKYSHRDVVCKPAGNVSQTDDFHTYIEAITHQDIKFGSNFAIRIQANDFKDYSRYLIAGFSNPAGFKDGKTMAYYKSLYKETEKYKKSTGNSIIEKYNG
jgi:hypothetical protein